MISLTSIRHGTCTIDKFLPDIPVIWLDKRTCPATAYNKAIDLCKTRYLIFCHSDVTFSSDMVDCVLQTIKEVPDFDVLGMVGGEVWSRKDRLFRLQTCDSCFIVLDLEKGFRFNDRVFNSYHFYVEELCIGKEIWSIRINAYEFNEFPNKCRDKSTFCHHSQTIFAGGWDWGEYAFYEKLYLHNKSIYEANNRT